MWKLEKAEGSIPTTDGAVAIVKLACLLVVGVIIINGVSSSATITPGGTFYSLYLSVRRSITYGYSIMGRILLTIAAGITAQYLDLI